MKSKFSYKSLAWNPRNRRWIVHETTKNAWKSVRSLNEIKEIIYDPCMKPKKTYMTLVWSQSYFFRISNQEHSDWSLLRVDFIFCIILVWLPRNHTNHIWPSTVTKNHIWPSTKSRKVVWSMTRVCKKCGEKQWIIFLHRIHRNHRISYENSPHSPHFLQKFTPKTSTQDRNIFPLRKPDWNLWRWQQE